MCQQPNLFLKKIIWILVGLLPVWILGCGGGAQGGVTAPAGWTRALPFGFPTPLVPDSNLITEAKIELGRHLFYDVRLSGSGTQSCSSCHQQFRAFTNGQVTAIGSTGDVLPRNVPTLGNVAYYASYTWANYGLSTLERHHQVPLFVDHPIELGVNDLNIIDIQNQIFSDPIYISLFNAAFPGQIAYSDRFSWPNITHALASFTRSLITGNSKYDQSLRGQASLSPEEYRGMALFNGEKAKCSHCHSGFNFTDSVNYEGLTSVTYPFHNTGLYNIDGVGSYPAPNRGIFELSAKPSDMGAFRAPTLRNIEVTAPYMHDGSKPTLESVIEHYAAGGTVLQLPDPNAGDGRANPYKDALIGPIDLTAQDKADLVAFLKTLTDQDFLTDPCLGNPWYPDPARPCLKK